MSDAVYLLAATGSRIARASIEREAGPERAALYALIYDRIDAWHDAPSGLPIYRWLGWTRAEYAAFVTGRVSS